MYLVNSTSGLIHNAMIYPWIPYLNFNDFLFFLISSSFYENQWFSMTLKPIWISKIFQELWASWFHITWEQKLTRWLEGDWNDILYFREVSVVDTWITSQRKLTSNECLRASWMSISIGNGLAQNWVFTLSTQRGLVSAHIWISIGSGNGLLRDNTVPISEPFD